VAHPLAGATKRLTWKNGGISRFLGAVNSCVTEWQGATEWNSSDSRLTALVQFLESEASSGTNAVAFEIVEPPDNLSGGDVSRGQAFFNVSCSECHGVDGRGDVRGPNLAGAKLEPGYVARRIRTSGSISSGVYPGLTGGRMPFRAADRLSDDELRDLVVYVSNSEVPDSGLFAPDAGDSIPATQGCGQTHRKIGWYADLSTFAHGVKGRATFTDDCTVTLTHFSYDGNGIDVRLFGAQGKDFARGFPIGGQLYRPGVTYVNVTMTMTMRLPPGKTLDNLDSVSVWCVAARHNFGDGSFRAP
jgi:mono/diheme cytochrome c family protein